MVSLKWHDSLPIITTAALDHIVRVWDARAGTCVFSLYCVPCVWAYTHRPLVYFIYEPVAVSLLYILILASLLSYHHPALPLLTTNHCSSPLSPVPSGALLLELTGHRDLVTNIEMRSIPMGAAEEDRPLTKTGEVATDMVVSVSDDHTARVFYFTGQSLLT